MTPFEKLGLAIREAVIADAVKQFDDAAEALKTLPRGKTKIFKTSQLIVTIRREEDGQGSLSAEIELPAALAKVAG